MGVTLGARFVAYDPAGESRGILPYPLAASARDIFNDIGGGSIDYLADAQHSSLLEGLCEIAAEVNDGRGWVEVGARMLRLKRGGSVIEETRTRRYTLQSYGIQLSKMRMLREEALDENGERIIASSSVGAVVKTLFDEAKARGNVTAFLYDFTAATDSNGQPWGATLPPVTLRFGDDLLSLLRRLADNGACDWKVQGRTLRMFKPDTLGVNRANTIQLFNGVDVLEAPDDEDATEMAGRIGVIGDDGRTYEAISPTVNPWGLWEETVNASGVKDIGGLQFIGEAEQRRRSAPRVQMTRKVRTVDVRYLPILDYITGDTITVPNQSGTPEAVRIRELQLDLSTEGVSVNATLNDLILERDISDRRNWQGMLGGASSSSGGSGSPSTGDDKRPPAIPAGFVCSTVHLWSPTGEPFSVLDVAFSPVGSGADGRPLVVQKHELYGRRDVVGEVWRKITDAPAGIGRITFSPMPVGEKWQFKVRAISDAGVPGEFTDPYSLKLAADTIPPDQPEPPEATTRLGQIIVTWKGRTAAGDPQPIDFAHADVLMATAPAGVGAVIGQISPSGTFVAPEQPYGAQRWFGLVSVDSSGNRSDESVRVTVTTKPLVDTDLIGRVIDGANVKLGSIQENVIAAGAISAEKIAQEVTDKIDQAASDATSAGATAAQAVADALDAQEAAGVAQSAAANAAAEALAAAGIANSKGKVLTQSVAPGLADRNDATLWIDTTGGANTPKRWNGTSWVAVTDKAATDAATAAAAAAAAASAADGKAVAAQAAAATAAAAASAAQGTANTAVANAATAQTKADAAKGAADAAQAEADAIKARGTDLITNGDASQGARNFSQWVLEVGDQPPGNAGVFWPGTSAQITRALDEWIPIDPDKPLLPSMWVRQVNPGVVSRCYFALGPYDIDGFDIPPYSYMEQANTRTTLAAPLSAGQTTVELTSAANWYNGATAHQRSIIVWNYIDGKGKAWAPGTYSRNWRLQAWAQGGISGNTITLTSPWTGATVPAGTPVGNTQSGGAYMYAAGITNALVPSEWTKLTALAPFAGVHTDIKSAAILSYPPATTQAKVFVLTNYNVSGGTSKQLFAGLSLSEANAAQLRATEAKAAADAAQVSATAAQAAAGNAQATANTAITSASARNAMYHATTAPAGTGTREGDIWHQWSTLAANGKLIGTWRWSGSAWLKTQLDETYVPLLNIGAGTYGSLSGDRLTARTVTADRLLVTDFQNYFNDPTFSNPAGYSPWAVVGDAIEKNGTGTETGSYALGSEFAVSPGDTFRVTATREDVTGSGGNASIYAQRKNSAGAWTFYQALVFLPGGTSVGNPFTIPPDTTALRLGFYTGTTVPTSARVRIRDVKLRRMTAGELIVDGAISAAKIEAGAVTTPKLAASAVEADKLAANAVTAGKIAANAVTADKIDALAVTAGKIAVNAVTADKIDVGAVTAVKVAANAITSDKISANAIDGKTITGALIRSAAIGERSEMTPSGFRTLDAAGQELVKIGYGIPTGMQVRSPLTGALVPLANAALGAVSSAETAPLTYSIAVATTPASSGGPGYWSGWTRHSADNCMVTFTAVSSRYVIAFSQFWTISTTVGSDVGIYVAPLVNGERLQDAGHPVAVSINMNASSTTPEMRGRVATGSIPIDTTPGEVYNVRLQFQSNGWGTTTVPGVLRRRSVVATPVFS